VTARGSSRRCRYLRIRLQKIGEDGQQPVPVTFDAARPELDVQHADELSVRARVGHHRFSTRIADHNGHGHAVVRVAAEYEVDSGNAARQLQVHVHPVVGEQDHRVHLLPGANVLHEFRQLGFPNTKGPIWDETLGVGDGGVGEGLADDGDSAAVEFLHHVGRKDVAGVLVENVGPFEEGVLGRPDVLRDEVGVEQSDVV
jgi:hypothetical protein